MPRSERRPSLWSFGAPIIGFIAQAAGLSVALGLLSLVDIVLVIGAALYQWPERVGQPAE